ncbi:Spy/CpxP family protein refolding chaperone [Phenylobacterium montanum]|uniref:Periplasmic heavy metal sensor n=1 Tax=Phenylobacterium montanum TaxID=2823693 RepID=A0A975IXE1_9CAUL|nr:periplasmic heavy metal sensor [Caulobacter sp. S6]QUD90539.1 periplasmic heavy metal sensor [Caulobacter sp. S6]
MSLARSIALTLILSIAVAAIGAWGGAEYALHRMRPQTPLHELVHQKLRLTADQQRRIEGLERQHEQRRQALQAEMRAANADLAHAIQAQHAYMPEVQAAVDRFHHAMGDLQKETILHVLAMRQVLTPEQAEQFDATVARSLTEEPR